MIKTSFVIILALVVSYMRLLPKIKDNEPAKAILNDIFSGALKQGLQLPISEQEIFINDLLAQMEHPLTQYFVDYSYNKELHENKFEEKPQNLLNSIHSIIEPGKDRNLNNVLKYILTIKEKSIFPPLQDLSAL
jgi:hypothetical protein